jgi:hypothetical protein
MRWGAHRRVGPWPEERRVVDDQHRVWATDESIGLRGEHALQWAGAQHEVQTK